jgi:predicted nucleic acid-binding protein
MAARVALDTNILAYAEGLGDAQRCAAARNLIEHLPTDRVLLPAQVLGELFRVLTGKAGRSAGQAREAVMSWADSFAVADSSWASMLAGFDLVVDHQLSNWDALILAVAADSRCRLLLSEDFQHGFTWRGTTVLNPFVEPRHALLGGLIGTD